MAKKYTDSEIWKRQRWFKKLSKDYKLAFFYIKDMCDNIGIWKIDCSELIDDTGIDSFNLKDFINCCNKEFDKIDGKLIVKERLKMVGKDELWITGFIQFQYESKDTGKVCLTHVIAKSALQKLEAKGLYKEAIKSNYLYVSQ
ncbi:MAG: hypothetical protein KBA90_13260 [Chitinophagaceae bacterium]|nr:hypothetical protein [Chitinophagaceae bacterium]MBP7109519.1 hypothetical protein [Chitinophagaceae bacterium]